ncbi:MULTISPECIES: hypothetical protein [Enterobacteriaceae]|uniref:Uncharacterized protein n=1 Tax=Yokenella regensburgei TaxID=158877 RepID=A0AB38G1B1_9ENTR|nr:MULTISPECIES: hypothetical protein [Enterobacteriaceae]KFD23294.1 hypothetical protein GYRE_02389 [Yokenella regensburgei ATCC 49455]SQA65442.1 Uncharacterised protein [Yokenella regensburgei]SQA95893.1 Uncharacterised protein [Yokenella regensburgei]SUQ04018.1 Uncharacterised protein [Yokenella regensburgei]
MKYLFFYLSFLMVSTSAMAKQDNELFACTAKTGEKIRLYIDDNYFVISVNESKIKSRNTAEEIKDEFKPISEYDDEYLEFNASDKYVSVGNFNQNDDSDDNPQNKLNVSYLNGSKKSENYVCTDDYHNNISSLLLN